MNGKGCSLYKEIDMSNEKKGMSITELIAVAKRIVVTEADIAAMNKRLREAEVKFEAEDRARSIDQAWLNRQYTI